MTLNLCNEPIYKIQTGQMNRQSLIVAPKVWPWLEEMADKYKLTYCLGHKLDGVFWGLFDDGALTIALTDGNAFIPLDQPEFFDLLCELRLFSNTAELHLWKTGGAWQASLTQDGVGDDWEHMDDEQMLWGTQVEVTAGAFTLMSDGVQGLCHAVPLPKSDIPVAENGKHRPLRLKLRHYLAYNKMGCVHIKFSRLITITAVSQEVQNDA